MKPTLYIVYITDSCWHHQMVHRYIQNVCSVWYRIDDGVYVVRENMSIDELCDKFDSVCPQTTQRFIAEFKDNDGWMPEEFWNWLKRYEAELEYDALRDCPDQVPYFHDMLKHSRDVEKRITKQKQMWDELWMG